MATLVLSAAGAALGSSIGGSALGLSSMVLGRAVGATLGQVIDRAVIGRVLMGSGSDVVEQGRVDRFRLSGASEGAAVPVTYGRMRVGAQVIWASRFLETVTSETHSQGKGGGGGSSTTVNSYSYSVSLALALGEEVVSHLGRIWADGVEIAPSDMNLRFYPGDDDQLPDPKIEAVEGAGRAPAFRGTAYVVIEDLQLEPFGNRVPQFSFEIVRPAPAEMPDEAELSRQVRAVAMVPGTGEYSLATTPVYVSDGPGSSRAVNVNTPLGITDFEASRRALGDLLPAHGATSLVVSWFGSDLRCGSCEIRPKVERRGTDGQGMAWRSGGIARAAADEVPRIDDRPVYGGTPADDAVIEAISALSQDGGAVMYYPFILMDQLEGNGLPDPWTGGDDQPPLPWRGRITLSAAPGQDGSPYGTAAAAAEVAAFFGTAAPSDFAISNGRITYSGPAEWSYRRFILHQAHLAALAGGVDAFCIGSEMRGLTQIRDGAGYPAVAALRTLAADVCGVLGPDTKIGYAADWSEYFGHHPQDGSGDVIFHLDPLWSDDEIDFIGIDNYMPLSDWRDGDDHADAHWGDIHDIGHLRANIAGGEGFDWYYASEEARAAQIRTPIVDTAHGEDWVFRYKDLVSWWSNTHHDRPGGARAATPTNWVPKSKPIWLTEIGCPAIDKGTNAPNLFFDPKSSESALPPHSDGRRDDWLQMQALRAQHLHWADPDQNPVSPLYDGPMVDPSRIFVWAWDARPFPFFPNRTDVWSDGPNYARGHWLNGRASARSLASVTSEIALRAGIGEVDTSALQGVVRGYAPTGAGTGRSELEPLMLAHGFDAIERDGKLVLRTRHGRPDAPVTGADLATARDLPSGLEVMRAADAETVGRVRVTAVEAEGDYRLRGAEAIFPDDDEDRVTEAELPMLLTASEARAIAERWLAEARIARDKARIALPPSMGGIGAGDVLGLENRGLYRVDRVERTELQLLDATRIEAAAYRPGPDGIEAGVDRPAFTVAAPVYPLFLDLPLLRGDEVAHAPHLAVSATPWPGAARVWKSASGDGYAAAGDVPAPAIMGETLTALPRARPGLWDRGPALRVKLYSGALASVGEEQLFNGANAMAIGHEGGDEWEVFQFATATLVAPMTYDLDLRLRGQAGSDAVMPDSWPAGARVVLIDAALVQPELALSERGLARRWRIGPATRPVSDTVHVDDIRASAGVGLRPLSPVHLRAAGDGAGGVDLTWLRRTRIDGDSWAGMDVPLGEDRESYLLRISADGAVVREEIVEAPAWHYSAAARAGDGATGALVVEVAQLSDRFGPGPFLRSDVNV